MSIIITSPGRGETAKFLYGNGFASKARIEAELAGRAFTPREAKEAAEIPLTLDQEAELNNRLRGRPRSHTVRRRFTWTRNGIPVDPTPRQYYDAATGKTYIGYAVL